MMGSYNGADYLHLIFPYELESTPLSLSSSLTQLPSLIHDYPQCLEGCWHLAALLLWPYLVMISFSVNSHHSSSSVQNGP
jgi:hypothetical protein